MLALKPRIAVSVGDLNGVGIEIALKAHDEALKICRPLYCINRAMLKQAAALLGCAIPDSFETADVPGSFAIRPGHVDASSGLYSYMSFLKAIALAENGACNALTTMPIHKEAWMKAGITFKGHTDMLRSYFNKEAIMMLGCEKLYVALYTEHMPLKEVAAQVQRGKLLTFLLDLHRSIGDERVAVLGLNPHAGDNGVLGNEEREIEAAIAMANQQIGQAIFFGPIVPDIAFTPRFRASVKYIVAMYHDQGLAPLKALYFDESINVSLNLPVVRTSVDHGTAFDIAYHNRAQTLSYLNALKTATLIRVIM